jgi:hypothetical protein
MLSEGHISLAATDPSVAELLEPHPATANMKAAKRRNLPSPLKNTDPIIFPLFTM